jgi:hypothetical protein
MEKSDPLFERFHDSGIFSREPQKHHSTEAHQSYLGRKKENKPPKTHVAAYQCDMNELRSLVTSLNVNSVDAHGRPALFAVIDRGFDDAQAPIKQPIEFLADLGANIDEYSYNQKMSALEYATRRALQNSKTLIPLACVLELGANPFSKNAGKSRSPFQLAYRQRDKSPCAEKIISLFRKHIKTIHQAVAGHDIHKVSFYVAKNGVHEKDYKKKLPLYYAIINYNAANRHEMLPILQILLNNKANPNEIIEETRSPATSHLLLATIVSLVQGDLSMIPHLLKSGGNPFVRGSKTPSAYDFALFSFSLDNKITHTLIRQHDEDDQAVFKKIIDRIQQNQSCALELMALFNNWGQSLTSK